MSVEYDLTLNGELKPAKLTFRRFLWVLYRWSCDDVSGIALTYKGAQRVAFGEYMTRQRCFITKRKS